MTDNKNTILAIVLSAIVLLGWQYFVGMPQMEKQRQQAQQQQQQQQQQQAPAHAGDARDARHAQRRPAPRRCPASRARRRRRRADRAGRPGAHAREPCSPRARASRSRRRAMKGSIALKGGAHRRPRADAVPRDGRPEVARRSCCCRPPAPSIRSMPSSAGCAAPASTAKLPDADTVWRQEGAGALTPGKPVTLTWDNGEGLEFRRTIAVDDKYLFTAKDEVTNKGAAPVTLHPLRADLAPRHAEDRRLLHPARRPDRRARRAGPEGRDLQEHRGEEGRSPSRRPTAGSASPTSTGRRRCCPTPTRTCRRASRPARSARSRPIRPTTCSTRRRSRRARPAPPTSACSPAPRKCRPSTPTTRRSASTASSC